MKPLISAVLLLALAAPGAQAQDDIVTPTSGPTVTADTCESIASPSDRHPTPRDCLSLAHAQDESVAGNVPSSYQADPHSILSGAIADGVRTSSSLLIGAGAHVIGPSFAPTDAHDVRPTTQPILDFSHGHRWVHVSGVALTDGLPVPGAKINVIAELDGGFNKYQLAVADTRGVYNTWFQAPAAISSVTVDVQSFCSTGQDDDCMPDFSISSGAGATASGTNSY